MVIKRWVAFICSFIGLRLRRRIKDSSSYEAVASIIEGRVVEGPNESRGGVPARREAIIEVRLCCVCLSRLKEGEETRVLPCLHEFHSVCVDRWFTMCRRTCPMCRFSMEEENSEKREELITEEMMIWFSSFHVAGF
ncbi:E3 ubiquitin-protein ligase At1g12760 [Cornus florida]|uniref:E3 ubiquitin-protein ligase At1g12760 n=1 Tax=Cornus florida TaxID=4283 RepID=UPI00289894BC|nr:E3 ubiquitin-protein ligase At1g12760 [Cornus florida]